MDTDKFAQAKAGALKIATTDKRIKLPIWAWVVAALALVAAGAWWLG